MNYFDNVSDILLEYYDNNDTTIAIETKSENNTQISALQQATKEYSKKFKIKQHKGSKKNKNKYNKQSIASFFQTDKQEDKTDISLLINKQTLNKHYRLLTNNQTEHKEISNSEIYFCKKCNIERILIEDEGICVCMKCGEAEYIQIESEKTADKETMTEKSGYPYKRINHFNETLAQFQAKEKTEIPDELCYKIVNELKKRRIRDINKITKKLLKSILKILGYPNYYEHIPYIIIKLNGKKPPTLNQKNEKTLRSMFKEIEPLFEKHKTPDRQNFLNYSYVLYKFFELLELDDFLQYCSLLKNRDKLRQHDKIWEKICCELKWQFIPSV